MSLARCAACSPRRLLTDNLSGVRSAGIDFQVQEPAFRTAQDVLLPGTEEIHVLRENRCLHIADAESPRRLLERAPCEALALGAHIVPA